MPPPNPPTLKTRTFTHALTPHPQTPFQALANPDDLISPIPEMDIAIAEYNSVPSKVPPYRDTPSILLAHLHRPHLSGPEPAWPTLLHYFRTSRSGLANLQDLYVFVTRVALANAVIRNRRMMLELFLARGRLGAGMGLRYDAWRGAGIGAVERAGRGGGARDRALVVAVPVRPIFRGVPTPEGARVVAWLRAPMDTPPPHMPVPRQMVHRESVVDLLLDEDEGLVRGMGHLGLEMRMVQVLRVLWWLMGANARMEWYRSRQWMGIEAEMEEYRSGIS